MHATDVKVYAGNAGPFLHGCVRYETADGLTGIYNTSTTTITTRYSTTHRNPVVTESDITGVVIIIAVIVVGLVLVNLVVVAIVYGCKRRRARTKRLEDNYDNNQVEMSPVSSQLHASAARHVQRSVLVLHLHLHCFALYIHVYTSVPMHPVKPAHLLTY